MNQTRPSISLAVIAKNEEGNVSQLLKSVEGCFDEIVFVDTGSTDNTVEEAKTFGAKVFHFEWVQDFSAARNFAFSKVTTDYVCWFDLDDALDNKDAFIRFRDHVMHLGDYWIAPYHYSSDASGKPTCIFARERVFRMDRGFRWKYPVHEGVMPTSDMPIKVQMVNSWSVRHMRTEADIEKDRSRNLGIFQALEAKEKLDARMRYYYGKELFEAQKPIEAIHEMGKALSDPSLEMHDRLLGTQYICHAYIQTQQWAQAISMAHNGLMLDPHRAEFHNVIADAYLKQGQLHEAIPSLEAAKACFNPVQNNQMRAVFAHEDSYTVYPRNQLARVYAHVGQMERARDEAKGTVEKYGNEEAKAILEEINRISALQDAYKNATPCDEIVITCPPVSAYEFDPEIAEKKAMGGSETALIEMAYWLRKKSGKPVKVFNMRSTPGTFDGVEYLPATGVNEYLGKHEPKLHISWRHNTKLTNAPTFLWCHDLTTPGAENTANYDRILCLTPFHARYVNAMQGIPLEKIHVTRNGLNPDKFKGLSPFDKDPFRFVFGSSPDRGLDRAMRVLDRVRVKYPQVTLHIHYGWEHLDKYGLGDLRKHLEAMLEERKDWVIYHGATQQVELMQSYAASAYNVQPSDWIETSCVSAMELVACGVYPIFRKVGGVADTLAGAERDGMATLVDRDCITESDHDVYAEAVIAAMDRNACAGVSLDPNSVSWEKVAEEWLRDLPGLAKGKLDATG